MAADNSKTYFIATDPESRPVTCTEERWKHIKKGHKEITRPNELKNTIQKPDYILTNSRKALIYTSRTNSQLYFNVIVHTSDDFPHPEGGTVATAHLTGKLLKGSIIWPK
jgi:hypothetical protein